MDLVASAGPAEFRHVIEATLASADALIFIHTSVDPSASDETLAAIREGIRAGRQAGATPTILACLMASTAMPVPLEVGAERVLAYAFPENAARALPKAAAYAEWRAKDPGLFWTFEDIRLDVTRAVCRQALDTRGEGWLTGEEVSTLLGAFALPWCPARRATQLTMPPTLHAYHACRSMAACNRIDHGVRFASALPAL
jgi:acyl-CoA synthetase (NDP forming)